MSQNKVFMGETPCPVIQLPTPSSVVIGAFARTYISLSLIISRPFQMATHPVLSFRQRATFCRLILKLLESPTLQWSEFVSLLAKHLDDLHEKHIQSFIRVVCNLSSPIPEGRALLALAEEQKLIEEISQLPAAVIKPGQMLGKFFRNLYLSYRETDLDSLEGLSQALKQYFGKGREQWLRVWKSLSAGENSKLDLSRMTEALDASIPEPKLHLTEDTSMGGSEDEETVEESTVEEESVEERTRGRGLLSSSVPPLPSTSAPSASPAVQHGLALPTGGPQKTSTPNQPAQGGLQSFRSPAMERSVPAISSTPASVSCPLGMSGPLDGPLDSPSWVESLHMDSGKMKKLHRSSIQPSPRLAKGEYFAGLIPAPVAEQLSGAKDSGTATSGRGPFETRVSTGGKSRSLRSGSFGGAIPKEVTSTLSSRQMDRLLSDYAQLLEAYSSRAPSYGELDRLLRSLTNIPAHLPSVHFLRYRNCLRALDYYGALGALLQSQDHFVEYTREKVALSTDPATAAMNPSSHIAYSILMLGGLFVRFQRKESGRSALQEAISLSQDLGDVVCLNHALFWLSHVVNTTEKGLLLRRVISSSRELQLATLGAHALLEYVKYMAEKGCSLRDCLSTLNEHDLAIWSPDFQPSNHSMALQSSLFSLRMNLPLAARVAQIALCVRSESDFCMDQGPTMARTAADLAGMYAEMGEWSAYEKTLAILSREVAHDPVHLGPIRDRLVAQIEATSAVYSADFDLALAKISDLAAHDHFLAHLKKAELYLLFGDPGKATKVVRNISLPETDIGTALSVPWNVAHVHVQLMKAQILFASSNIGPTLPLLGKLAAFAEAQRMGVEVTLIKMYLAAALLHLGLFDECAHSLSELEFPLCQYGSCVTLGRYRFLQAKLHFKTKEFGKAMTASEMALDNFLKGKVFIKTAEVALFQGMVREHSATEGSGRGASCLKRLIQEGSIRSLENVRFMTHLV